MQYIYAASVMVGAAYGLPLLKKALRQLVRR